MSLHVKTHPGVQLMIRFFWYLNAVLILVLFFSYFMNQTLQIKITLLWEGDQTYNTYLSYRMTCLQL